MNNKKYLALLIVGVVALLIAIAFGLLYWHSQQQLKQVRAELQKVKANPTTQEMQGDQALIDQIGKLIVLPADEQPTIATVTDLDKLKGQAFFANAQIGDKVLIYTKAKKAILYRPSEQKIVELAPLNQTTN